MAYTDPTLSTSIAVKKAHVSELASAISTLATNARKGGSIDLSTLAYTKVTTTNITLLRKALNDLEGLFSENCCQADCCQTCQTSTCQSSTCQSCQDCQTCQKCQTYKCQYCQSQCKNCNCNCNCDCGDDGGP